MQQRLVGFDTVKVELNRLKNEIRDTNNELCEAQAEKMSLKLTERLQERAFEEVLEGLHKLTQYSRRLQSLSKSNNLEVRSIRCFMQDEMQQLRDKLTVAECSTKNESQLKEKLQLRLKLLEDGMRSPSTDTFRPTTVTGLDEVPRSGSNGPVVRYLRRPQNFSRMDLIVWERV